MLRKVYSNERKEKERKGKDREGYQVNSSQ